jgi:hypothetical protein
MDFNRQKEAINRELDHFIQLLNNTLPRYTVLLKQVSISNEELKELGEIEYFLLEVNSKINEIKQQLEHDLFGHSLDQYYKLKKMAENGDQTSKQKFETMRKSFNDALQSNVLINWN